MKIIIAALGTNGVIGHGDKMPWWVPEEYQQFLNFITGQTVIMGRKTYEIFSKDLPSKRNLVISRQNKKYDRAQVFPSFEDALQEAEKFPEDIFIAGGATIYENALSVADKMYLSYIKGEHHGDTYFPEFDKNQFRIEKCLQHSSFEFVVYSK